MKYKYEARDQRDWKAENDTQPNVAKRRRGNIPTLESKIRNLENYPCADDIKSCQTKHPASSEFLLLGNEIRPLSDPLRGIAQFHNGSEAAKVALLERIAAFNQKAELNQACLSV
jgi:hypothetical protein